MSEIFKKAEKLAEDAKEYINTRIEILKLTIAEKSSAVLATIIAGVIAALIFSFFLLFISITVAVILSTWIGKPYIGFLIVAGFYLISGVIILKFREQIIRIPIMNSIIRQLFKDDNTDDKKD
jgi:phosphate/sulfate permease